MTFLDSYPTEFYVSDVGYLVLKQECFGCGYETQFLITPEQILRMTAHAENQSIAPR